MISVGKSMAKLPARSVYIAILFLFVVSDPAWAEDVPQVTAETRRFWSFVPLQRPPRPVFDGVSNHPIDSFVELKLTEVGLRGNPIAPKQTLIRRAYYDLTGLPPTPVEVEAFINDEKPDAYERLIDQLLASPHYGEKWGRHWLDLVRYAETNSYERDADKPNAWKYRDYVIESFNADKPFDQFAREQLAGDEMPERTPEQLTATGFYRLGIWDDEPVDAEQALYDDLDDILTTTCQTFLGLTINCARCHDHKLDPISQEDYYRMLAFFSGVTRYGGPDRGRDWKRYSQLSLTLLDELHAKEEESAEHQARMEPILKAISKLEANFRKRLPGGTQDDFNYEPNRIPILKENIPGIFQQSEIDEYQELFTRRDALAKLAPVPIETVLGVTEIGPEPRQAHVLLRGNAAAKRDKVQPGFPQVLDQPAPVVWATKSGLTCGRRTALANWIASPYNPLTARVITNRVWQHHFGVGIVRTPNNFGLQGEAPTHPELLDWLAVELVEHDWSLKHLHRLIMTSDAYRRSSADKTAGLAVDPENRLLWRYAMRRLTAEEIRDSILAVSGRLNRKVGGPSVFPPIPDEVKAGQSRPGHGWGNSTVEDAARRSVYIYVKRSLITPLIASFDGPDTDLTCPVRFNTTQPTQSLSMINGSYVREQAQVLQEAVDRPELTCESKVTLCLRRVLQRQPSDEEVERGVELINALIQEEQMNPDEAFHSFCVVAMNLNEFIYLD